MVFYFIPCFSLNQQVQNKAAEHNSLLPYFSNYVVLQDSQQKAIYRKCQNLSHASSIVTGQPNCVPSQTVGEILPDSLLALLFGIKLVFDFHEEQNDHQESAVYSGG